MSGTFKLADGTKRATGYDVTMLYRILLGREPESRQVVEDHARATLAAAWQAFIQSDEFKDKVINPIGQGREVTRDDGSSLPTEEQFSWLLQALELDEMRQVALRGSPGWDRFFRILCSLDGFLALPPIENKDPQPGEDPWSVIAARLGRVENLLAKVLGKVEGGVNPQSDQDLFTFDRVCTLRQAGLPPLPNLVGVGAGRCGTTSLFHYLRSHPDVFLSPVKEVNFFGVRSRHTLGIQLGLSVEVYRMFFLGYKSEKAIGEFSPIYLRQPGAAEEMRRALGRNCRIIVQVRHPIDRFISQYQHHSAHLNGQGLSDYVAEALSLQGTHAANDWYAPSKNLEQSLYADAIQEYYRLFGTRNVLVLEYEELKNVGSLEKRISDFLEIPAVSRSLPLTNVAPLRPHMDTTCRRQLLQYYEADTIKTSQLLGLDLSHWRV